MNNDTKQMFQVRVIEVDGEIEEELLPITDPILKELLRRIPESMLLKPIDLPSNLLKYVTDPPLQDEWTEIFVPTECFRFLNNLHQKFENHRVLLADFSFLAEAIEGIRAPAVSNPFLRP
jgi:hypothetical protein